jgi:hypothetical protein
MVILKGSLSEYCYPPLRRQEHRVPFFLFSFDPAGKKRDLQDEENKKQKPFGNMIIFSINRFSFHSYVFDILPQRKSFSFLPSQQKRKYFCPLRAPSGA